VTFTDEGTSVMLATEMPVQKEKLPRALVNTEIFLGIHQYVSLLIQYLCLVLMRMIFGGNHGQRDTFV